MYSNHMPLGGQCVNSNLGGEIGGEGGVMRRSKEADKECIACQRQPAPPAAEERGDGAEARGVGGAGRCEAAPCHPAAAAAGLPPRRRPPSPARTAAAALPLP